MFFAQAIEICDKVFWLNSIKNLKKWKK